MTPSAKGDIVSMMRYFFFTICGLALAGCGPDTADQAWILGTFSNHTVGQKNIWAVTHYEFREDNSLVVSATTNTGKTTEARTYVWAQDGEDAVVATLPGIDLLLGDNLRFTPGTECDQVKMQGFKGDSLHASSLLFRGKVCIHLDNDPCPIGHECNSDETRWCDDPPPACSDGEDDPR